MKTKILIYLIPIFSAGGDSSHLHDLLSIGFEATAPNGLNYDG